MAYEVMLLICLLHVSRLDFAKLSFLPFPNYSFLFVSPTLSLASVHASLQALSQGRASLLDGQKLVKELTSARAWLKAVCACAALAPAPALPLRPVLFFCSIFPVLASRRR